MDWSLLPTFLPSVQEQRGHPTLHNPYRCYTQAVGEMHPPGNFRAQASHSKERMLQAEEKGGKPRNRWRAHKKATCQCAVCKQVRGELPKTWFKHDRANCKCSVCRQARGEKRVGKLKVKEEIVNKTSLISNRVMRLSGRAMPTTNYNSPNPTKPGNLEVSDVSSMLTNVISKESSAESLSLIRVVPSSQSDMVGAGVNLTCEASTSGSFSGLLEKMVSGIVDTSTGKFANLRALLDAKQTTPIESSVQFTPSTPSSQLYSDTFMFSWRAGSSFAESKWEIPSQSSSPNTSDFSNLRDLSALSRADHNCVRESSLDYSKMPSVVPSSQSYIAGTRLSGASVCESRSESCQLTPEITDTSRKRKLADREGVRERTHSFSDELLMKASSITASFSSSQLDSDRTALNWNGGPSICENNEAFPGISNMQISEYTSTNKSVVLAHASDAPQSSSRGSSSIPTRKRKKNWMCTLDRNTCGCHSCTDKTSPSNLSSGSKIRCPGCNSTRKRRKLLSLSMHITEPLQAALNGVISTAYPRASQSFEKLANVSLLSLYTGRDYVAGSHEAPATVGGQHSHSSAGSSLNLGSASPEHGISQSPTMFACSYEQMTLASPVTFAPLVARSIQTMAFMHVSGINVSVKLFEFKPSFFKIYTTENPVEFLTGLLGLRTPTKCSSLVKFSEQAGKKLRRTSTVGIRYLYRSLLWILEQAGGILLENIKVRMCRVQSTSDSSDHKRYPHTTRLSIVEVLSQKAADIRTHRSQSVYLLGKQPCSLPRVAHINPPRRHDPFTSIRTESFNADCLLRDVKDFSQSIPNYNVYTGLEGWFCHKSGPLHDIQIQIHPRDTEKGRPILALANPAAIPNIQLGLRCFLDPICTTRPYTVYSSLSACTRGVVSFSCTDTTEEKLESFVDTGMTSEKRLTKVRDLTTVAQDGLIMQQQKSKRKFSDLFSYPVAVQPSVKRRSYSKFSTVSPVLWQISTSKVLGNCSPSASGHPSMEGVFQVAVSKSPGEFVTASQGKFPTNDGKIASSESDKSDDDSAGQLKHISKDLHSQSTKNICSGGTQSLDSLSQIRVTPLIIYGARQIAHFSQAAAGETTCQGGYSALSSGLSFQELLKFVSQDFAMSSPSARSSRERISIHPKSCIGGKSDTSINQKAQGLQSLLDTKLHSFSYGEEPCCKQLQIGSLNAEDSRLDDAGGDHEDLNLSGDISNVYGVPATNRKSSKSKRMEDGNLRHPVECRVEDNSSANQGSTNIQTDLQRRDLEEVVNSSPGVRELVAQEEAPPTEVPRGRDHSSTAEAPLLQGTKPYDDIACRHEVFHPTTHKVSSKTGDLMVTNDPDLVEVEVLQSNVLVEQDKTEFEQKLNALLEKPFDALELEELEKSVSARKPQMRLRESRQEVRHVPLTKEGLSYLEHYPDFHRKWKSTNAPQDKLKLLREFFFWIQHTCMLGAFMPWEERDRAQDHDIQILEEKSTMSKRTTVGNSTHTKEVIEKDKQGGATQRTRDPGPRSYMHMSLRPRKEVVYERNFNSKRAKKVANQLATTEVKTECNDDTCPEIRKELSAVCKVTAMRRTSLNTEGKVDKNHKSGHQQHRKYHK